MRVNYKINVFITAFLLKALFLNAQVSADISNETKSKKINFSVGAQAHLTSSLLPPNTFLSRRSLSQIFDPPKFSLSPEINLTLGCQLNKHEIGLGASIILYQRILSLSLPISLNYAYDFSKNKKKTPFVATRIGYSFFITEGALFSIGGGYKLNRFRFSFLYNNQWKRYSSMENNKFKPSRISSFSMGVRYRIF